MLALGLRIPVGSYQGDKNSAEKQLVYTCSFTLVTNKCYQQVSLNKC